MSVRALIGPEDHDSFNLFSQLYVLECRKDVIGTISSDSEKNWIQSVRANQHPSRFRVQIVESPSIMFCIHGFDGFMIDSSSTAEVLLDPVCNNFQLIRYKL